MTGTDVESFQPAGRWSLPKVLHGTGVLLSVGALAVSEIPNPSIGFPIAVAVVAALGYHSSPSTSRPAILRTIRGGVTKGGMRQGAFIKSMFAVALFIAGSYPTLLGTGGVDLPSLLLGMALLLSSVGTELEARRIDRFLQASA